jgi:tape measure domain-containing protein
VGNSASIGDVVLGIRIDDAALNAGLAAARARIEGAPPVTIPAPRVAPLAQGLGAQALQITPPPTGLFARFNADLDGFRARVGGVRAAWSDFIGSFSGTAALFAGIGLGVLGADLAKTGQESQQTKLQLNALTGAYGETAQATEAVARVQAVLGISAVQARGDYAGLYASVRGTGITAAQTEVLLVGLQKAARLSGQSAAAGAGAFIQLKQGLASGKLAGDELRSVLEAMPALSQALARNLGVPVGALKELGAQGKITTDVIYAAVAEIAGKEVPQFTAAEQIGNALTNLKEKVAEALGPIAIQVATNLGAALVTLSRYIQDNAGQIQAFAQGVLNTAAQLAPFAGAILSVAAAYQAWSIAGKAALLVQTAVLAVSGPAGIAQLAVAVGLVGAAYLGINQAGKGVQAGISQTTAKIKAETVAQKAAFDKVLASTGAPQSPAQNAEDVAKAAAKADALAERERKRQETQRIERIKSIQSVKELLAIQSQLNPGGQGLAIAGINPQTVGQVQQVAATLDLAGQRIAQSLVQGATRAGQELLKARDQLQQAERAAFDLLKNDAQRELKANALDTIRKNLPKTRLDEGKVEQALGIDLQGGLQTAIDNVDTTKLFQISDQVLQNAEASVNLKAATEANTKAIGDLVTAYANAATVNVTVPAGSAVGGDAQIDVRYN